jgi:hypothetical protein
MLLVMSPATMIFVWIVAALEPLELDEGEALVAELPHAVRASAAPTAPTAKT